MIKQLVRRLGQGLLGFDNYLFLFAWFSNIRMRYTGAEKEFRFFLGLLPHTGAILDIGANIGIMSVAFARYRPQATVYAFEPMPVNLRALQRVLRHYRLKQVLVMPYALGNTSGLVSMLLPLVEKAKMQGYSHVVEPGQQSQPGDTVNVPIRRLDDVPELRQLQHISAIKMDVENYEYFVLQGGATLINKHRPLIYCELWDNARRTDCIDFLRALNYAVKVYAHDHLVDFTDQPAVNFFFIPHEKAGDQA